MSAAAVARSAASGVGSLSQSLPVRRTCDAPAGADLAEALAAAAADEGEPASPASRTPGGSSWRHVGMLPPAPFFPKGPRAAPTRGLLPMRRAAEGLGGDAAEVVKGAEMRVRRLEQEISDLREAYARKIASTELKCEGLLRDKDKEMTEWFKEKRHDISKMKASMVIMRSLFIKAREKFRAQAEAARRECELEQERILAEAEAAKQEHEAEIERMTAEMRAKENAHRQRLAEVERQRDDLQRLKESLETQLAASQRSERSLRETNEALRLEGEELKKRVTELEASDEMQRKNAAIETLEQELKRTKKHMQEKSRAETEALRKELMDYVKFIVNILPDSVQMPQVHPGDELQSAREFRQRMSSKQLGCRSPKDATRSMLPPVGMQIAGLDGGGLGRFGPPQSARSSGGGGGGGPRF